MVGFILQQFQTLAERGTLQQTGGFPMGDFPTILIAPEFDAKDSFTPSKRSVLTEVQQWLQNEASAPVRVVQHPRDRLFVDEKEAQRIRDCGYVWIRAELQELFGGVLQQHFKSEYQLGVGFTHSFLECRPLRITTVKVYWSMQ